MKTSTHIDWLSVTIPHDAKYRLPRFLHKIPFKESKARYGYGVARTFINGVVEYSAPFKESMGTHVVYSGKSLERIRLELEGDFDPLSFHWFYGHKVTRIDYALDMIGDDAPSIAPLIEAFENGNVNTGVRSLPKVISTGKDQHETMYIGSMKKRKKLMRIYRKDIQLGGGYAEKWLRAELECRNIEANSSVDEFMGIYDDRVAIKSLIKGFCDFPDDEAWTIATGKETTTIPTQAHRAGNTKKWLIESVVPALAKEVYQDPRVLDVFAEALEVELQRLKTSTIEG